MIVARLPPEGIIGQLHQNRHLGHGDQLPRPARNGPHWLTVVRLAGIYTKRSAGLQGHSVAVTPRLECGGLATVT